jgi:hypothetical protein
MFLITVITVGSLGRVFGTQAPRAAFGHALAVSYSRA